MKKITVIFIVILMTFLTGCDADKLTEGNILYDCGIESIERIEFCEMLTYNGSNTIDVNNNDIGFLKHYTFKEDYPVEKLHEVFVYPGVTNLMIKSGNISKTLYILENGDIVVNVSNSEIAYHKTYTTDDKYLATREKIDKIANVDIHLNDSLKKPYGTKLPDGSILYKESTLSKNTVVEFKDDKGNVLIDNSDIVKVYAKFSEDSNYYIEFEFTENGKSKFKVATEENIGKIITISANNEVLSSPTIPAAIESSSIIVVNNQSYNELIALFDKITK